MFFFTVSMVKWSLCSGYFCAYVCTVVLYQAPGTCYYKYYSRFSTAVVYCTSSLMYQANIYFFSYGMYQVQFLLCSWCIRYQHYERYIIVGGGDSWKTIFSADPRPNPQRGLVIMFTHLYDVLVLYLPQPFCLSFCLFS